MARAKYMVDLAEEERVRLRTLLRRGKASLRMVARARVLLRAEEGYTDAAIAAVLDVGTATVGRIRKRFVERGLEQALREQPRPGQRRKLSGKQEAHVIAVACTTPPEGHGRWTLRLLAGKVVELGFAPSISPETGGYVNRCVNDIRRRPSQPLIQWRFHPHTVHRGRRLRSTQGPSDA